MRDLKERAGSRGEPSPIGVNLRLTTGPADPQDKPRWRKGATM